MSSKPYAEIELSVSVSPDTVSLSRLDEPLNIIVAAKTISSSKPSSGVVINTRWTALDDRGAGLFMGALFLKSISDPAKVIPFAPAVSAPYPSHPPSDLRKSELELFKVVPGVDKGELTGTHEINGERIFQYSTKTRPSDISPGSEYRIEFARKRLGAFWWTFEDEAEGKMFFDGMFPDEDDCFGLRAEDPAFIEERYKEGYLYSYQMNDLKYSINEDSSTTIRFVE
ncbi:uncharacterized protein F4807DRAFT_206060 [Annulohypoxylon truncatum]|uniref:uncharacterized protein n=1 Tax=Annulohypoxylon truncatum TaxID=327061 RepID=UPI00200847E1|nr:uncharacterized protein F4807DRAFT_206060 [Annulohypoxylon truncatum]KAI1213931.1 hypothetical protein F4807DRAFT_206060 [Annulohypoxylon truncatum]